MSVVTDAIKQVAARTNSLLLHIRQVLIMGHAVLAEEEPSSVVNTKLPAHAACELCGARFSVFKRKIQCQACEKYFCTACYGSNTFLSSFCSCRGLCKTCTSERWEVNTFDSHIRPVMEEGVACVVFRNHGSTFYSSGETVRTPCFLSLDSRACVLQFASLELRDNKPIYLQRFDLASCVNSRAMGDSILELHVKVTDSYKESSDGGGIVLGAGNTGNTSMFGGLWGGNNNNNCQANDISSDCDKDVQIIKIEMPPEKDFGEAKLKRQPLNSQWASYIEKAVDVHLIDAPGVGRLRYMQNKNLLREQELEERRRYNDERKRFLCDDGGGGIRGYSANALHRV